MTTADESRRPFVSLGPSDRDPADEHYDATQLLVLAVLRQFTGTLLDAVRTSAKVHELLVSEQIMEKAYYSPFLGKPDLVSVHEIAEILDTTARRVYQLDREDKRFPPPLARLKCGPVWLASDIKRFKPIWDRRKRRPSKEKEKGT